MLSMNTLYYFVLCAFVLTMPVAVELRNEWNKLVDDEDADTVVTAESPLAAGG